MMFKKNFNAKLLGDTPSPYSTGISAYLSHIHLLNQELSCKTKDVLQELKKGSIKHHQFKDIPVTESLPPTSTKYIFEIPKETFQSEGVLGAVSLELGKLFNYRETSEHILYDIYPVKGCEQTRSFVNSKKMLSFHSDGSAHPEICPDYVLLYCLRNDKNAVNLVVDLDDLLVCLPTKITNILSQPLFKHLVTQTPERYELKPILYRNGRCITVKYDEDNTFGVNEEARFSQECLNLKLREIAVPIENFTNSLLILNNKRCLHARTSFSPKFDGRDRWIKCAFVTEKNINNGSILSL